MIRPASVDLDYPFPACVCAVQPWSSISWQVFSRKMKMLTWSVCLLCLSQDYFQMARGKIQYALTLSSALSLSHSPSAPPAAAWTQGAPQWFVRAESFSLLTAAAHTSPLSHYRKQTLSAPAQPLHLTDVSYNISILPACIPHLNKASHQGCTSLKRITLRTFRENVSI